MATARFVFRKSDSVFVYGGFYDAQPPMIAGPPDADGNPTQVPDPAYAVAEFGDADLPDLKRHRYQADASGPEPKDGKRPATAQELAADEAQALDATAARELDARALKALLLEIYPYLSVTKPSLQVLRANIIARYKALA